MERHGGKCVAGAAGRARVIETGMAVRWFGTIGHHGPSVEKRKGEGMKRTKWVSGCCCSMTMAIGACARKYRQTQ